MEYVVVLANLWRGHIREIFEKITLKEMHVILLSNKIQLLKVKSSLWVTYILFIAKLKGKNE